jgi:hypothetical protein
MRYLTNKYEDCHLIRLDPSEPGSPLVVTQEGVGPDDPKIQTRLYYLQKDGKWINEIARSTRPDSEAGDVVFESASEVIQLLTSLFGKAIVRELPVSQSDVEAYVTRMKSIASPEVAYREFLARYRAAKKRK